MFNLEKKRQPGGYTQSTTFFPRWWSLARWRLTLRLKTSLTQSCRLKELGDTRTHKFFTRLQLHLAGELNRSTDWEVRVSKVYLRVFFSVVGWRTAHSVGCYYPGRGRGAGSSCRSIRETRQETERRAVGWNLLQQAQPPLTGMYSRQGTSGRYGGWGETNCPRQTAQLQVP